MPTANSSLTIDSSSSSSFCNSYETISISTIYLRSSESAAKERVAATKHMKRRPLRKLPPSSPNLSVLWPFALLALAAFHVIKLEIKSPLLRNALRGKASDDKMYVPPSLDIVDRRKLSLDLGGGNCKWQPPTYQVPGEIDFHKTIIAGFPSGDKRMIFIQMEALTGWPAKDEWDFEYEGMSNHPFIKANYPHHEGIWGWGNAADQVVMMVRNIRRSMVEYHDILWDIGYAKTWEDAKINLGNLYSTAPPIEDFYLWRDERVIDECYWYGWFIDYWMEGGLMRDIFTHKVTTPEHWYMLMIPGGYSREELDYDLVVGDREVMPSYDPHCSNGDVTDGCAPKAVISAEKLRDYSEGPAETTKIATALRNDSRMGQYVIAPQAWDCIWEELILNGKGIKTVVNRPGFVESDYNFSAEMLQQMLVEQNRLIAKYSSADWNGKATADRVVELIVEHRALVQIELNEVNSGVRKLTDRDFLGPKERRRRLKLKRETGHDVVLQRQEESNKYFDKLERDEFTQKQRRRRHERRLKKKAKSESDVAS